MTAVSSPLLGGKGLNCISVVTHLIWWRSHSRARAVYTGHGRVPDSVYPMWSSVGHSFGLRRLMCMEGVLQYWLNIEETPARCLATELELSSLLASPWLAKLSTGVQSITVHLDTTSADLLMTEHSCNHMYITTSHSTCSKYCELTSSDTLTVQMLSDNFWS